MAEYIGRAGTNTGDDNDLTEEDFEDVLQVGMEIDQLKENLEDHIEQYQSDKEAFVTEKENIKQRLTKVEEACLQQQKDLSATGWSEIEKKNASILQEVNTIKERLTNLESDREQLVALQRQVENLKEENHQKMLALKEKEDEILALERRVGDLEEKHVELEKSADKLYLSQAAFIFEQAVCSSVLPEVFSKADHATIKALLNLLNGGQSLPLDPQEYDLDKVLQRARLKWNELCVALGLPEEWKRKNGKWKPFDRSVPSVLRAVALLKRSRIPIAHPKPIKLSLVEDKIMSDSIKDDMPSWEYKVIKEFINSLV